ncbi:serine/arginine repetitive matrix protein 3, partial [Nycticebus coucang]|uniref:serine/arginine repetitive matrix protein 3 n=1 Tax=Nycticebus coucang TaxID=9470 RepID=UPI00234D9CC9
LRDGRARPAAPPPPPLTEPLPAAARAADNRPAGAHGSGWSFLKARVRSPASPARPRAACEGRRGLAAAARGGRRGAGGSSAWRRKRRARRRGPSPERSPLQPQQRAPSVLPAPQTRRWRRQLREEAPVLQRHLALQHRLPPTGEGGATAAGSIGARSPRAPRAAGPAPSRRAGMRRRAPRRPIRARRPLGPPRVCLPVPRR